MDQGCDLCGNERVTALSADDTVLCDECLNRCIAKEKQDEQTPSTEE